MIDVSADEADHIPGKILVNNKRRVIISARHALLSLIRCVNENPVNIFVCFQIVDDRIPDVQLYALDRRSRVLRGNRNRQLRSRLLPVRIPV